MQIEITPQIVVATIGIGLALQSAIVAVAVMIRGTARDLARESREREEAEKATEARFALLEKDARAHAVELRTVEVRSEANERAMSSLAATVGAHAQAIAALGTGVRDERRRR